MLSLPVTVSITLGGKPVHWVFLSDLGEGRWSSMCGDNFRFPIQPLRKAKDEAQGLALECAECQKALQAYIEGSEKHYEQAKTRYSSAESSES